MTTELLPQHQLALNAIRNPKMQTPPEARRILEAFAARDSQIRSERFQLTKEGQLRNEAESSRSRNWTPF